MRRAPARGARIAACACLALAAAAAARQDQPLPTAPLPRIAVGETVAGRHDAQDAVVTSPGLAAPERGGTPTVGDSYQLVVERDGPHHVDLRGHLTDVYLVLRDAAGTVIAEDDDGLFQTHARIAIDLRAGEAYRIDACALHGHRGPYELTVHAGAAPVLSPPERAELELADLTRRVQVFEEEYGADDPRFPLWLDWLGNELVMRGRLDEADVHWSRSLALRERRSAADPAAFGQSLNNLSTLRLEQGRLDEATELLERALPIFEQHRGSRTAEYATLLNNLGVLQRQRGDFERSIDLLTEALSLREDVLGPEHTAVAETASNLAGTLGELDRNEEARRLYERAVEIFERAGDAHAAHLARTQVNLGNLLAAMQALGDAEPYLRTGLATLEQLVGPDDPVMAHPLGSLGALLLRRGDGSLAREPLERAIAVTETALGPEHPSLRKLLQDLGRLAIAEGDYDGAEALLQRALAIQTTTFGPGHPHESGLLDVLAGLHHDRGEFAQALRLGERSLAIELQRGTSVGAARAHNNLGLTLLEMGRWVDARRHFERCLEIVEAELGPEHPDVAGTYGTLALMFWQMGDERRAAELIERALQIAEASLDERHPKRLVALTHAAAIRERAGDWTGAATMYAHAIAAHEGSGTAGRSQLVDTLVAHGRVLHELGDLAGARAGLERALAIATGMVEQGTRHPAEVTAHTELARVARTERDPEAAARHGELAARAAAALYPVESPIPLLVWGNLIHELLRQDRIVEAAEHVPRIGPASVWLDSALASQAPEEAYHTVAQFLYLLELRLDLAGRLGDPDAQRAVYEMLLTWKGRVGRLLAGGRAALLDDLDDESARLAERLRLVVARMSRLATAADVEDRDATLERLAIERGDLERSLRGRVGARDAARTASWEELRRALPAGSAVVDLFVWRPVRSAPARRAERSVAEDAQDDRRVTAFITRPDVEHVVRVELGAAGAIEAAVLALLGSLRAATPSERGAALVPGTRDGGDAGRAYELVWGPLAQHLDGVGLVLLSPDGVLSALPLQILHDTDGRYLVEDRSFVDVQDVGALPGWLAGAPAQQPAARSASLLALGAVDFAARTDVGSARPGAPAHPLAGSAQRWSPLPGTAREVDAIAALHARLWPDGERVVLTGAEATETRLAAAAPRHAVLHLATHGFFEPDGLPSLWQRVRTEQPDDAIRGTLRTPLGPDSGLFPSAASAAGPELPASVLSGLVCAGAESPAAGDDDGYLTSEEVSWLDLDDVELVVLSACETGLGRVQSGEGLLGLRRAFRTAGARTVVSSLWSVDDDATAELMADFYRNLWERGLGPGEALRAAQLAMLERQRGAGGPPRPETWGAFVLSGEWR